MACLAMRAEVVRISIIPSRLQKAAWQVAMRFGVFASAFVFKGSFSITSSPAPAITPLRYAAKTAFFLTMPPRAVFTRYAVGFIIANSFSEIK